MTAVDPRTGRDWTELQFLQGLRLDLAAVREALDVPGPYVNLCPNPRLANSAAGWSVSTSNGATGQRVRERYLVEVDYAYEVIYGPGQETATAYLPEAEVTPGTWMSFAVDARFPTSQMSTLRLDIQSYDDGQYLGTATPEEYNQTEPSFSVEGEHELYIRATTKVLVPQDATEARVLARGNGGTVMHLTNAQYILDGPVWSGLPTWDGWGMYDF